MPFKWQYLSTIPMFLASTCGAYSKRRYFTRIVPPTDDKTMCPLNIPWNRLAFSYFEQIIFNEDSHHRLPVQSVKPPNIYLISSPIHNINDTTFKAQATHLERLISRDTYVVQLMPKSEYCNYKWHLQTRLLVILQDSSGFPCITDISNAGAFLRQGGKVLVLLYNCDRAPFAEDNLLHAVKNGIIPKHVTSTAWKVLPSGEHAAHSACVYGNQLVVADSSVLNERNEAFARQLLSELEIETSSTSTAPSQPTSFVLSCDPGLSGGVTQAIKEAAYSAHLGVSVMAADDTASFQPPPNAAFNLAEYQATLKTRFLGRSVLWAQVMDSSWTLMDKIFRKVMPESGLLICSDIQLAGRGRGGNKWISPLGMAAFTFSASIRAQTANQAGQLAQAAACSQHLAGLVVVLTARWWTMQALGITFDHLREQLIESDSLSANAADELYLLATARLPGSRLAVKWPNDVYALDDCLAGAQSSPHEAHPGLLCGKLGGILSKASLQNDAAHLSVGVGLNLANQRPTFCLHEVIRQAAIQHGLAEPAVLPSVAQFVASYMDFMERVLREVEQNLGFTVDLSDPLPPRGLRRMLQLYTLCWAHTKQRVRVSEHAVADAGLKQDLVCYITGLDDYGYLVAVDERTGRRITLHPDGNSLDMMQGLIMRK